MSRRLRLGSVILLVVIWAGVLLSPKLRLILRSQIDEFRSQSNLDSMKDADFAQAVAAYPNDPRVLAAQIERLSNLDNREDFQKARLREYDVLIEKFPIETGLIKNRLRLSTVGGFSINGGELMTPDSQAYNLKSWLSRAEIFQALRVAEHGARLEPENSFYDWMRAIFLFSLKRDEAALRAFQQGANKSRFDDGVQRDMQNRDAVRSMQSPALWEERVTVSAAMLLPHYAAMVQANRAAVWHGALAERKDKHQRSLEIYRNQIRLASVMRHDASNTIELLVAEAMQRQAWGALARKAAELNAFLPGDNTRKKILQQTRDLSQAFATYARLHKREDLAQATLREAANSDGTKITWALSDKYFYGGSSVKLAWRIGQLSWLGTNLLRAILVAALSWAMLSIFLLLKRNKIQSRLILLDAISSVIFVTVALTSIVVFALMNGAVTQDFAYVTALFEEPENFNEWTYENLITIFQIGITWMPSLLTLAYCGLATLWRTRKNRQLPAPKTKIASTEERSLIAQIKSGSRWSAFLMGGLALCYLMAWWVFWLLQLPSVGINNIKFLLMIAPLPLPPLMFYLWKRQKSQVVDWLYFIAWSRSTLGALILIGSIAYFATSLTSLPLRHEANARLDDFLARGEVAVLRDIAQNR